MLVLENQNLHLLSSALFPQVSCLLYQWNHSCNSEEYEKLINGFWKTLTNMLLGSLTASDEDSLQSESSSPSWVLGRQVDLCLCLRSPKLHRSSQKLKVKFTTEDESSEPGSPVESESSILEETSDDKGLQTLAQVLSACYFKKFEVSSDVRFLIHLTKLANLFKSREFFLSLLSVNICVDEQTAGDSLVELYDAVLCKWLKSEKTCSEEVVSITFLLLEYLSSEEKDHVLESLCQVNIHAVVFRFFVFYQLELFRI